jgi:hypothetical protein
MKLLAAVIAVTAFALSGTAAAADNKPTAQQEKMKNCNMEASDKKLEGDARKSFMSDCLKTKQVSQQDKMKVCNKEAGAKKLAGDARKSFMSDCLKADRKV